jgi:hypothetical protein
LRAKGWIGPKGFARKRPPTVRLRWAGSASLSFPVGGRLRAKGGLARKASRASALPQSGLRWAGSAGLSFPVGGRLRAKGWIGPNGFARKRPSTVRSSVGWVGEPVFSCGRPLAGERVDWPERLRAQAPSHGQVFGGLGRRACLFLWEAARGRRGGLARKASRASALPQSGLRWAGSATLPFPVGGRLRAKGWVGPEGFAPKHPPTGREGQARVRVGSDRCLGPGI